MIPVWKQDFPTQTFEIVSAELPSGSAWLVNCLLELDVSIWNPWDVEIPHEWSRKSQFQYTYKESKGMWCQTLPALKKERSFNFDPCHSGRTTHRWPTTIDEDKKILFFVRDPRDMLYSQWRRLSYNEPSFTMTFIAFLQSNYHHFPVNYVNYLCVFLTLWKARLKHLDYHVVRFEDYKSNALETLKKALFFMGVMRTEKQMLKAIKASDFKVVKQAEEKLAVQGKLIRKFNFTSQPLEYQQHLDKQTSALFDLAFNPICRWLGYESINVCDSTTSTSIKYTEDWSKTMVDCIYGDHYDPINAKRLYQLFMNEFGLK